MYNVIISMQYDDDDAATLAPSRYATQTTLSPK